MIKMNNFNLIYIIFFKNLYFNYNNHNKKILFQFNLKVLDLFLNFLLYFDSYDIQYFNNYYFSYLHRKCLQLNQIFNTINVFLFLINLKIFRNNPFNNT